MLDEVAVDVDAVVDAKARHRPPLRVLEAELHIAGGAGIDVHHMFAACEAQRMGREAAFLLVVRVDRNEAVKALRKALGERRRLAVPTLLLVRVVIARASIGVLPELVAASNHAESDIRAAHLEALEVAD